MTGKLRGILIALVVVLCFGALPTTAQAGLVFNSGTFSEKRWERIVNFRPCGGEITYRFKTLPSDRIAQAVLYKRNARERFGVVCRVELAERYRKYLYDRPQYTCSVVLHEVGHLAGKDHNNNPRSIMFGGGAPTDARCRGIR
jgi:hypothetical protein